MRRLCTGAVAALFLLGNHGYGKDSFQVTQGFQITPGWMGVAWSDPPEGTTDILVLRRESPREDWQSVAEIHPEQRFFTERLEPDNHAFVQYRVKARKQDHPVAEADSLVLGVGSELVGNAEWTWDAPPPLIVPDGMLGEIETVESGPRGTPEQVMAFADPGGFGERRIEIHSQWMWVKPGVRYHASLWLRIDGPMYPSVGIEVENTNHRKNPLMNWRNAISVRDEISGEWGRHWTSFELDSEEPVRIRFVLWVPRDRDAAFAVADLSLQAAPFDPLSVATMTRAKDMLRELEGRDAGNIAPSLFQQLAKSEKELREIAAETGRTGMPPDEAMSLAVRATLLIRDMEKTYFEIKNRLLLAGR